MTAPKPTHLVVLFAYGEHFWTQLTVLSFLSAQNRLDPEVDVPKFRTMVITDKPKFIKAYFGTWVELISVDKTKLDSLKDQVNGDLLFRMGLLHDIVGSRQVKVLNLESDIYFTSSPLIALNYVDAGSMVLGAKRDGCIDKGILGFGPDNLSTIKGLIDHIESMSEPISDLPNQWKGLDTAAHFDDYYHYNNEMELRKAQIASFFDRHYYRDMGELFSMVGLWTPDKWHFSADELPEELI